MAGIASEPTFWDGFEAAENVVIAWAQRFLWSCANTMGLEVLDLAELRGLNGDAVFDEVVVGAGNGRDLIAGAGQQVGIQSPDRPVRVDKGFSGHCGVDSCGRS
jgi:hypothetical protein